MAIIALMLLQYLARLTGISYNQQGAFGTNVVSLLIEFILKSSNRAVSDL